jgi:hypothetical protein
MQWRDVINEVENANIPLEIQSKKEEKYRGKKYLEQLDQEIYRHQHLSEKKSKEKVLDRY